MGRCWPMTHIGLARFGATSKALSVSPGPIPFEGLITRETFNGTTDLASTQPVNFIVRGDARAFLATGVKDEFVRPANSDSSAARLRSVGTTVLRRRYANIGHVGILTAIARPLRDRAAVLDDISVFANRVTR